MDAHTGGIGNLAASCSQVSFIVSERLGHGQWLLAFTFVAAGEAPHPIYGLPVIQDRAAIGGFKITACAKASVQ